MSPTDTEPSPRLIRAAAAEQEGLERQRGRLQEARTRVLAELQRIDEALGTLAEREMLLERLAPAAPDADAPDGTATSRVSAVPKAPRHSASSAVETIRVLSGPAIRETAVRVLLERGGLRALHYRVWFQMLEDAGYTVAGKDPLAVFLTQISRSPIVRKTTQSGVYELDREAPQRLRRRIEQLQGELRELTTPPSSGADLREIRARRKALTAAIGQAERALEESDLVLAPTDTHATTADPLPALARAS